MKKILFIVVALLTTFISDAQTTNRVYCQLLGHQKFLSTKCVVTIDYGQETNFFSDTRLVDENGKPISFNSMVDAMNYMGTLGWKFEASYLITIGRQHVYHWLLSKDITINENNNEGFITKDDFKNKNIDITPDGKPSKDELRNSWRTLDAEYDSIREQMKGMDKNSDEYKTLKSKRIDIQKKKMDVENLMFKHYNGFIK